MDKRLVGKWYKEALGETVNIFDETPPRMKMSFTSSGHYNVVPNRVYADGDDLCYEINDERFRVVYHVHYESGRLCGYCTQFGKETPVVYEKQSDIPEDGDYRYAPTILVPETDEPRIDILRAYSVYAPGDCPIPESVYALNGAPPKVLTEYGFDACFDGIPADSDQIAFAALNFVCDHFGHDGCGGMGESGTIAGLIAFCEAHDGRMNCRGLALLLAAILRLKGLKARHITCKPYEEPFADCHVVVDCLLPSGRRVMLDPTSRLYYTDWQGEPVSLRRLRELLIAGETLRHNPEASYNKGPFDAAGNRAYMIKNTFRFSRGFTFSGGADEDSIDLIPAKYVEKQRKGRAFTTDDANFWKI